MIDNTKTQPKLLVADIIPDLPDTITPDPNIKDIIGFFDVVSVVPTNSPKNMWDSIKIYVNGATLRQYIYDFKNRAWRYSTLT